MFVQTLVAGLNQNNTSNVFYLGSVLPSGPSNLGVVQIDITGVGTVTIQGRINSEVSWIDLATTTESASLDFRVMPEVRYVVTDLTGLVTIAVAIYR